jgi:hypothetical protein
LLQNCLTGQSPYQESYAAESKSQSELRGGPQAERGRWEKLPSQCIRNTPRSSRASASINPVFEPKPGSSEALCLCWNDRFSGRRPIQKSQTGTKIGVCRKKVRDSIDARTVRIFKSDAFRGSGSDGKGFGRRSASGRLHCRRWHLGLGHFLRSDAGRHWSGRRCVSKGRINQPTAGHQ